MDSDKNVQAVFEEELVEVHFMNNHPGNYFNISIYSNGSLVESFKLSPKFVNDNNYDVTKRIAPKITVKVKGMFNMNSGKLFLNGNQLFSYLGKDEKSFDIPADMKTALIKFTD